MFGPDELLEFTIVDAGGWASPSRNVGATVMDKNRLDQQNLGISKARLIGRPWLNGAKVTCRLEWNPGGNIEAQNLTESIQLSKSYLQPVHVTTEVFCKHNFHRRCYTYCDMHYLKQD